MWLAENWRVCQSWIILFSWDFSSCGISICTAYWRKGKNIVHFIRKFLSYDLLQTPNKYLYCRGCGWELYVLFFHVLCLTIITIRTDWEKEVKFFSFLYDMFHPFLKYSCDALLVTNKSQFFSKSFCSGKEGNS